MRCVIMVVALAWAGFVLADGTPTDSIAAGKAIYTQTCIACHGVNGKGTLPGVRDFTAPDGPLSKTDAELLKSIRDGFQRPGSPLTMPARGGNPALTDHDIELVLGYLRETFGTR
jgi:mono/diheme cytochrome c family protein